MRLDQIAGLLRRLRPLVQPLALGEFQQLDAEIMRAGEIGADEMADPEPARGSKGLFVVVELLAELERADVVLLDLLHGIALGGDQRVAERDAQLELHLVGALHARIGLHDAQTAAQMADRLQIGAALGRLLAGLEPEARGALALAGFGQMMGEQLGFALGLLRIHLGKHLRDPRMQLAPLAVQQAVMRGVLDHHMLEGVERIGRMAAAHDQPRLLQMIQRGLDLLRRRVGDRLQRLVGELAADGGADLRDPLERAHAVEPRHQRVRQGRRDRELPPRARQHVAPVPFGQQVGFEHRLGELFQKQRHAVGLDDDLLDDFLGQLPARDALDQRRAQLPAQAVQHQRRDVRMRVPARLEFGASGDDDEDRPVLHPVDQEVDHLTRGRVDPVQILERDHQRHFARKAEEVIDQRRDGRILLLLRRQLERRIAVAGRESTTARQTAA